MLLPPAKKDVSSVDHINAIRHTINTGSAMYNSGHVSGCAKVYMTAVAGMVEGGQDTMPPADQAPVAIVV